MLRISSRPGPAPLQHFPTSCTAGVAGTRRSKGSVALRDVKNHLSEVVHQVEREHGRVTITRHGKPAAVVVSVDVPWPRILVLWADL